LFGPPSAWRWGRPRRFSCICYAPASCSLKSALVLFFRQALKSGQWKLIPPNTRALGKYF
jgi:hypothetical protein